jgi:hypothetical protein
LEGHLPVDVIRTFRAFLEFCYIARQNVLTEDDLDRLKGALERFHQYRTIFKESGVRKDFSLPRQHSLIHYHSLIRLFGAPNGLCSSITESKHIRAVKEPWRRSNRREALGQMLVTNQRLDQLAAARAYFNNRGMLTGLNIPCKSIPFLMLIRHPLIHVAFLVEQSTSPAAHDGSSKLSVQASIPDEDPLEEAVTDPNSRPGVRLPVKPSELWRRT